MDATWIFPITAGVLVIVEVILTLAVFRLTKNIKKMNDQMEQYFGKMMDKVKGLVDLFIAVQTVKLNKEKKQLDQNGNGKH